MPLCTSDAMWRHLRPQLALIQVTTCGISNAKPRASQNPIRRTRAAHFAPSLSMFKKAADIEFSYKIMVVCTTAEKIFVMSWPSIVLASHPCTCVLHRQLSQLHTLKWPEFFHFHGDFHQKWHFAHPKISFAHPELPFLAKSMWPSHYLNQCRLIVS